jgi:sulfatase maturation enzyme AslB (radical SAM superfamily)
LCCRSTDIGKFNLKKDTIDSWWASDFLAGVRQQMLAGQEPSDCQLCYWHEAQGAESMRQKSNREYKIYSQYAEKMLAHYGYPKNMPIEIELQLTNLCNLKCLMCNEEESSTYLSENKQLKISVIDQTDYKVTAIEIDRIKEWIATKPKRINFRGGEPMMVAEIKQLLQWAIVNNLLDNTEIYITTNLTKLDDEWEDILRSIKHLKLMVSIDSIGPLSEYIRYGSSWNRVESNVLKVKSITNNIIVHAVVQNLNILHIDQLIKWCARQQLFLDTEVLLGPAILKLNNLPQTLLDIAREKLSTVGATELMSQCVEDMSEWTNFKKEIELRDEVRSTSIFNVLPELKEYWNAKTN